MTPDAIWRHLGGRGDPPACLGSRRGPLLVLGGGRTLWEDFGKVRPWGGEIMCVNDTIMHVHDVVAHHITLHEEYTPGWRKYREGHCLGRDQAPVYHGWHRGRPGIDVVWEVMNVGGSSGLFAVFAGLMLGYESVLLAGVPIDNAGHYFDPPWVGTDLNDGSVRDVWRWAREQVFANRVRSLSGNTREWLGGP